MAAPVQQAAISPDVLARVGRSLFGEQWQTPLARALGMSDRSLRYMAAGDRGIHAGIVTDLLGILEERGDELHAIAKELRKALR